MIFLAGNAASFSILLHTRSDSWNMYIWICACFLLTDIHGSDGSDLFTLKISIWCLLKLLISWTNFFVMITMKDSQLGRLWNILTSVSWFPCAFIWIHLPMYSELILLILLFFRPYCERPGTSQYGVIITYSHVRHWACRWVAPQVMATPFLYLIL